MFRKPVEIDLTVSEVLTVSDKPPRKQFWDYLPVTLVGWLRRIFPIKPTEMEKWYIKRGLNIMIQLTEQQNAARAEGLYDQMLEAAKAPKDPKQWN